MLKNPSCLRFTACLAMATLLIVAQSVVLAHAFDHDLGTVPGQTCTVCAAAAQLSSAAVDQAPESALIASGYCSVPFAYEPFGCVRPVIAQQRGPPASP